MEVLLNTMEDLIIIGLQQVLLPRTILRMGMRDALLCRTLRMVLGRGLMAFPFALCKTIDEAVN